MLYASGALKFYIMSRDSRRRPFVLGALAGSGAVMPAASILRPCAGKA
jgi:hypothetical protein